MSNDINIAKLAQLANLDLDKSQKTVLKQELSDILTLINQLQEVNTDHITPLSHPHDQGQPLRADQVNENNQRDALQTGAPAVENGLFIVPQFIETE